MGIQSHMCFQAHADMCAVCTFFLRSVRRHIGPRTFRMGGGVWMDKKSAHLGALTPAEPAAPLLDIVER